MTQIEPTRESPPVQPAVPRPSTGRLVGVDLARALAVFGMYTVHVGPPLEAVDGVDGWLRYLADGRSSILFATLAGFSLMLIAGRREPKPGRQAKAQIAIRAAVLLVLGTAMTMLWGDVVILAFYGLWFLLALPLVRLRARTLAIIAAVLALALPQLAFGLKLLLNESITTAINAYDPLERLSEVGVLDLLLTGLYPTLPWMTFVIAGMALGRLDLSAVTVRRRLAALGPALMVLGYGTAWLLGKLFDGVQAAAMAHMPSASSSGPEPDGMLEKAGEMADQDSAWSLLMAEPHSGTTFDIIGSVGFAITVIVCATVAMERLPRLRKLMTPIIAVGTMSLTAYVGHFVVMEVASLHHDGATYTAWLPLLVLIAGAILFAGIWSRFFRRGPLEYLLSAVTKVTKFVR
ncbi:DUF418 domain-containing protein [Nonomuraea sp. NPDC050556]|uniref:DUF418 domain-containing protein n=1 Tax=Nonomuraea sp. NPDC050556 TaxID=3364369 RepID=UPI0037B569D8